MLEETKIVGIINNSSNKQYPPLYLAYTTLAYNP